MLRDQESSLLNKKEDSCLWDVFSELLFKFIDKKRCIDCNAHVIEKHPSPFAAVTQLLCFWVQNFSSSAKCKMVKNIYVYNKCQDMVLHPQTFLQL